MFPEAVYILDFFIKKRRESKAARVTAYEPGEEA
jgi:hypothetical protein